MKQLCENELPNRYSIVSREIRKRLEKEIDIIIKKSFVSYFLINWDIVNYAKSKEYYYVGRGSGANSIVAYLLGITDVDPIELDLYFERFINLFRQNPPDFDIDFSWKDREDITRYIFKKFPTACLLGTYNTFKRKGIIRELGKVYGLPKSEIEELCYNTKFNINDLDDVKQKVLCYSKLMEGMPNHISVHASGIIIPEKKIAYFCSTFMPPKGYETTHFSMLEAENVGLFKLDILRQRGLSKIKDCLEIIKDNCPDRLPEDIRNVKLFKEDKRINELLERGEAIGCFYIESPAMRMLLSKLNVNTYLGLVAASSIIRPGVAKSGMMREYILRQKNPDRIKEAHPILLEIMPETYGIMVYQEDVIKVAHHYAGLTLAESDELRRGMSGKYRLTQDFEKVKSKYFENCDLKGYDRKTSEEIWMQIESFAGYAFSKGHSASYAVESYQCLYLKAYYPLEYLVATINNGGGFYRREFYIHEAKMHGGEVFEPSINYSGVVTTIYNKRIYLGFNLIKDIELNVLKLIVKERSINGGYSSFIDFIERVKVPLQQLILLIRAGAFIEFNSNVEELLWKARFYLGKKNELVINQNLFKPELKQISLPKLERNKYGKVINELELLGFTLTNPFKLAVELKSSLKAKDLKIFLNKSVTICGYLVTVKRTKTSNNKRMNFGTFLDLEGNYIDTVHFPNSLKKYPVNGGGIYTLTGKVVEEFDFYSIEVNSLYKNELIDFESESNYI